MDETSNYIFQSIPRSHILYGFLHFFFLAIKWEMEARSPAELPSSLKKEIDSDSCVLIRSHFPVFFVKQRILKSYLKGEEIIKIINCETVKWTGCSGVTLFPLHLYLLLWVLSFCIKRKAYSLIKNNNNKKSHDAVHKNNIVNPTVLAQFYLV